MNLVSQKEIDKLPAAELKAMVKSGILQVMNTTSKKIADQKYTDLPQYKKHQQWKGIKISVSEASRVFRIPNPTISRWASRGLISILLRTDRELYLDKADVAYCSEIYRERKGSGKWIFNDDRTPYTPLTRQAT